MRCTVQHSTVTATCDGNNIGLNSRAFFHSSFASSFLAFQLFAGVSEGALRCASVFEFFVLIFILFFIFRSFGTAICRLPSLSVAAPLHHEQIVCHSVDASRNETKNEENKLRCPDAQYVLVCDSVDTIIAADNIVRRNKNERIPRLWVVAVNVWSFI